MHNWKWNKEDYHPNFGKRALWRKKRVKFTCEKCGAKQGEERVSRKGRAYKVMVAAAHVNHDPCKRGAKLIILCQICHLRYDALEHGKKALRTRKRKQVEEQIQAGQLQLPFKQRRKKEPQKEKP